ncbi:hypothetical protein [Sinosporangium siamense]|uniref:Uncharacterized protein n=1 Tax=Sinosporangium siamense TaxID=1367973 RepID=A0A919RB81_9ACTN|nr:hypothetical protein [Sinosporangium siamense]GII90730.1 hypothetical protein Ssi02_09610 [Sinosporangium siamense]
MRQPGCAWALFAFETRRLLCDRLLWGAAGLCLALRLLAAWRWLPDFNTDPIGMSGSMLLLAAAAVLVAHLAAGRDRRDGVPEVLAALPGGGATRTAAAVAAAVTVGTGIAAFVMALYLAVRAATGPVAGTLDPYEALAGVLAVPYSAALGVLLARWVRQAIAAPVTVFLVGALTWLNGNLSGYGDWFLPVVLFHGMDWPGRPSGLHVVYLVAATVLMVALALLRHGIRAGRLVAAVTAGVIAVPAGAVASARAPGAEVVDLRFATGQVRQEHLPAEIRDRYLAPDVQRCRRHGPVTFCAFPDYVPWIPLWAGAVGPVAEALPPQLRARLPVVRQATDSWRSYETDTEPVIRAYTVWSRGGDHRALLAAELIHHVTGLRRANLTVRDGCDARGQARTIVALWLLGQVVPPALPRDEEIQIASSTYTAKPFPLSVRYGTAELTYARRLLATPGARERIWAHWETLTHPGTTIEQALPLLGLRAEAAAEPAKGKPCW